jgi:hypothetical protein
MRAERNLEGKRPTRSCACVTYPYLRPSLAALGPTQYHGAMPSTP